MKAIHLAIAFLLEIIMIAALAVAGYHLSSMRWLHYTLAIALPSIAIIYVNLDFS